MSGNKEGEGETGMPDKIRCMGCMEETEEGCTVCPLCGYRLGTPPKEAYHMLPGTIVNSRYLIGRVLGYGGFGVTYIGYDTALERKVAVKEFLPSTFATRMPGDTEVTVYGGEATEQFQAGLDRFVDEAKRLAGFNGVPGIVDIYDTFVENNTAYIVMEYLRGVDVKEMLNANGAMPFEEARDIILKVCEALKPVHEAGIIHRDISPDNIYITMEGEVKLLDFGASRYATSVNSKSLSVILKSGYAPEEQYRSRGDQGAWSDVYALAATFYKMITGMTPEDSMERAVHDELQEPSKLGAVLPQSAENAIMNALNVKKEFRTQTVEDFARGLQEDRVERIKVKRTGNDTGKMSAKTKGILLGSLGLMLLMGLLTVTGVIGGGNYLRDSFGSAVPEGSVNAPGIVNLTEEKAMKLVRKAGLEYMVVGREYSEQIEKGKILTQTPLPGRVIEKGKQIEVVISGGSKEDAVASGDITMPDVTYMTAGQAIYEIDSLGFGYDVKYEYNDTVAEGLVSRMETFSSGKFARLYVSLGKNENSLEIRAPLIFMDNGILTITAGIDQEDYSERWEKDGREEFYKLYLSADEGKTWELYSDRYYGNGNLNTITGSSSLDGGGVELRASLDYVIGICKSKYLGQELMLKIEQYGEKKKTSDKEKDGWYLWDSVILEQKVKITSSGGKTDITSVEEADWKAIEALEKQNLSDQNNYYLDLDEQERKKYRIYRINGDFRQGRDYEISNYYDDLAYGYNVISCIQDGCLYLYEYCGYEEYQEPEEFYYVVRELENSETGPEGVMTATIADWNTVLLHPGREALVLAGETEAKAEKKLKDYTGKDVQCDGTFYEYSDKVEEGRIIRFIFNEYDNALHMEYFISLGKEIPEESNKEGSESPLYGNIRKAKFNSQEYYTPVIEVIVGGIGDVSEEISTYFYLYYSTDGGTVWQQYTYTADDGTTYADMFGHYSMREDDIQNGIETFYITIPAELIQNAGEASGKEIMFKVERYIDRADGGYSAEIPPEEKVVDETMLISYESAISVSDIQVISWDMVGELIEAGKIDKSSSLASIYSQPRNYDIAYRLTGNFKKGERYYLLDGHTSNMSANSASICMEEGVLYVKIYYPGTDRNDDTYAEELKHIPLQTVTYKNEEGRLLVMASFPVYVDLPEP